MKIVPVILIIERSNHDRIRTNTVEGYGLPINELKFGIQFFLFGRSLSSQNKIRIVNTSPIMEIELIQNGNARILTQSQSIYLLDYTAQIEWKFDDEVISELEGFV